MPLDKSGSKKALDRNIKTEYKSLMNKKGNKSAKEASKQAFAIAKSVQRKFR